MIDPFVEHVTPPCGLCGERSVMRVDADRLKEWRNGTFIQVAFPEMTVDQREQLKTGIHKDCWDLLFPEPDAM